MKTTYGWSSIPRTVVHDKATYMVNHKGETLQSTFATALAAARLRSWAHEDTRWMAGRFSDVYPHETCIAHIRRLLENKFVSKGPGETWRQFRNRMSQVEEALNSDDFAARDGGGLLSICQCMRARCEAVVQCDGGRLRQ